MYLGQTADWAERQKTIPVSLAKAFDETLGHDLEKLSPGRYDLKSVPEAFFLLQSVVTKNFSETRAEAHKKFIDIQYVVRGAERYGVAHGKAEFLPEEDMLEEKDLAFFPNPEYEHFFDLRSGEFAIFYPGEIHRPMGCVEAPSPLLKVVVKVPVLSR